MAQDPAPKNIPSSEISLVIQGPLYRKLAPEGGIEACLASVRKYYPDAEIIISTWKTEDISGLEADQIIQSDMPEIIRNPIGNDNTFNCQLASARAGLLKATRPYAMKMRADFTFSGTNFTQARDYDPSIPAERRLFTAPITMTNLFIRNPVRMNLPFHYSDLIQFGRREDIVSLWDIPLLKPEEMFRSDKPEKNPFGIVIDSFHRWEAPEQSLILSQLRKKKWPIKLKRCSEISRDLLEASERLLVENFHVIDWEKTEINFPKRFFVNKKALKTLYSIDEIEEVRDNINEPAWRKNRFIKAWLNAYVFAFFRSGYYVSLAGMFFLHLTPSLLPKARKIWRRYRKLDNVQYRKNAVK